MRVFINKKTGKKWYVLDYSVVEGTDAFFLKNNNISLPKSDWEEIKDNGKASQNEFSA